MSDKKVKVLVFVSALFLLLVGTGLYYLFEKQGYGNSKESTFVKYDIKDYVETKPVIFSNYDNVYSSINVSRINIKNISNDSINVFLSEEDELIDYITGYYSDIVSEDNYTPTNTATSNIKVQINGTVLSVFYEIDFTLDEELFSDNIRSYITTINIDLGTEKVLSTDDLLSKYSYTKEYIANRIFDEDVMISNSQVLIDKNTNISLTKSDIERKKKEYVNRIISEFDNIIKVYIENNSLTLVYDKKVLNNLFFDNEIDTDIKIRYLK